MEGRLPQVLLFTGPTGIGKQRLALWLAQRLVCTSPGAVEPCGSCKGCRQVLELAHPDLHWFVPVPRPKAAEADKQADEVADLLGELHAERRAGGRWGAPDGMALHGMGSVRLLQRRASLTASAGGARVVILGDAERLIVQEGQQEAPNALLKLLEEPPPGMTIVLTAADARRLLPTILSRVVPVRLRPLDAADTLAAVRALHPDLGTAEAERMAEQAEGAPGRTIAREKSGRSKGAATFDAPRAAAELIAACRTAETRAVLALTTGVAEARGRFTELLDALAETLAEAARGSTGLRPRAPLPPALAEVRDTERLAKALAVVQRTRITAQGNVNPQLLTAVMSRDLEVALWR